MVLKEEIEDILGEKIYSSTPLEGGGGWAQVLRIETAKGPMVLKHRGGEETELFFKEATGLNEIRNTHTLSVPEILTVSKRFLLLELIPTVRPTENHYKTLALGLGKMHSIPQRKWGFRESNFLGKTLQPNAPQGSSWGEFFWKRRLWYQCSLALEHQRIDQDFARQFACLEEIVLKTLDIRGPFSLLHGDIWQGNVLFFGESGAALVDPAVYYGDKYADLAMMALFGGFPPSFWTNYEKIHHPDPENTSRISLYKLYHIMNHLYLFGGHYKSWAKQILVNFT